MPEFPPNIYGSLSCLSGVQTYQLPRWLCRTSLECPQFWILALEGRPEQRIPGFLPWWHGVDNRGMVSQNVTNSRSLRKTVKQKIFPGLSVPRCWAYISGKKPQEVKSPTELGCQVYETLKSLIISSELIQIQPSNASDWSINIYVPTIMKYFSTRGHSNGLSFEEASDLLPQESIWSILNYYYRQFSQA